MPVDALLPPGPKPLVSAINLYNLWRDVIGFFHGMATDYGDVSFVRLGPRRVYLFNRPDLIQDVLVTHARSFHKGWVLQMAKSIVGEGLLTSEDDLHRRQRKLLQPAFHRQRIAGYVDIMANAASDLAKQWEDGRAVDVSAEMMRVTLSIAAKALFGASIESEVDEVGTAFSDVLELFNRFLYPFAPLLDRLPLPSNARNARALARLNATIYRLIAERRASPENRGDIVSMLLAAQDEDDGSTMSNRQVRDEAITLLLAGHETTALALSWTWYLLSQHPDIEARLHEEIDRELGDRLPCLEDVGRLVFARKVLSESMRLYPPAYMLGREAVEEYRVEGYVLPAGSTVLVSPYSMHRDPRYYDDPEQFLPDRWTPEMQENLPRFAYFPFGGGPRVCIGESFAWSEAIVLLAVLARRWRLALVPGRPVAVRPLFTTRVRSGMPMVPTRRHCFVA